MVSWKSTFHPLPCTITELWKVMSVSIRFINRVKNHTSNICNVYAYMSLSSQRITRAIKLIFQEKKIPFLKSFMLSVMNLKLLAGGAPALDPFCYYWWDWEPWKIKTDKHHERAFYFLTFKFCFSCGNCSNLFQLFICMINHLFINIS